MSWKHDKKFTLPTFPRVIHFEATSSISKWVSIFDLLLILKVSDSAYLHPFLSQQIIATLTLRRRRHLLNHLIKFRRSAWVPSLPTYSRLCTCARTLSNIMSRAGARIIFSAPCLLPRSPFRFLILSWCFLGFDASRLQSHLSVVRVLLPSFILSLSYLLLLHSSSDF